MVDMAKHAKYSVNTTLVVTKPHPWLSTNSAKSKRISAWNKP